MAGAQAQKVVRSCFRLVLAATSGAVLLWACGAPRPGRDLGTRAVVIGIDSADWKVIESLAAEGGMKHLMALRERGVWGELETLNDIPLSPVVWTSIATGKTPAKHGITWFMVDQPDGTRAPVRSTNRKVKAIWNILAEGGRRPNVVGWWATYPAEAVGKGVIISDALGFHGFGATGRGGSAAEKAYPESWFERANAVVPAPQQVSYSFVHRFVDLSPEQYRDEMFDPARFPEPNPFNPIHLFQEYAVTAQGYTAIDEQLLERDGFDLFLTYFEQVDSFSHLFMKYMPPKLEWVDQEAFDRYRDVVARWYEYQDELLGRLLAKIDLERTAVFVVSDHGFKSGERRIRSEETVDVRKAHLDHEPEGIFIAAGPHLAAHARIAGASVLDVTPTLLHYLGFPIAKDMDGKVLEDAFAPEFLERNPIRYVTTYEDADAPPGGAPVTETPTGDTDDQVAAAEAGLRALGYLEDSPGAPAGNGKEPGEESSPEIHNNLGRIHLRNGDLEKARAEFESALALDPRNAEALLNLGSIHRAQGRIGVAEQFVKRALRVDPSSISALSELGEMARDRGDLPEAVRLFEEALGIDDSQPWLFLGYGDVLQRSGRYGEAEKAFRTVLELDPDSFQARYNLGVTYANQGRFDDAGKAYEEALEIDSKSAAAAQAFNNLGAMALDRGDVDEAAKRFEQAVAVLPGHFEARYNLALIRQQQGKPEEAIELLEGAAAIAPDHELVNIRLGFLYLGTGRGEDAFRAFTLVQRLYPQNWAAPLGLAVLHAGAGQTEEARRLLQSAIEIGGQAAEEEARQYPVLAALSASER